MNASLLILLLLFVSICHGQEQDGSPPSGILPTTKRQNKVEAPLEVSCPDPLDIEPCECTNLGYLSMNCSNVLDEEQLRGVFSAFFPATEFLEFKMEDNHGLKTLEDGVFGNVSFRFLEISACDLETVETDALTPSLSTLSEMWIKECNLEIFPLERLAEFTLLEYLDLSYNMIHTLPPLSSSLLRTVDFSWNLITSVTADAFALLPAAEMIFLGKNLLTEIPQGTFTGLPNLEVVYLNGNNISYLPSLTFDLVYSPDYTPNLNLYDNNIEYVEVDAFKGVQANSTIYMYNNTLTRLPEAVWRPVLAKTITVKLAGNALACGCDVDWLVRDPQLLAMASDAHCAGGTLLTDLDPTDFDICG